MAREQPVDPTAQRSLGKLAGKTPIVAFLLLALAIGTVGYAIFAHLKEAIRQAKYQDLGAVADLKVSQIVGWSDGRRGDAAATTRDPILAQEVQRWLQRGAPHDEVARSIESRLQGLREAYSYDKVILLDRRTRPALVAGDALHQHAHPESNQRAAEAMSAGRPVLSDLHLEAETDGAPAQVNIDLYAPLLLAGRRVVGSVYFQIDPYRFLFPFIQSWPTSSSTAESLLVRRDGDDVLYLNELRHRKDSSLRFRLPLNSPDLPAAKSLRGETGVVEGVDYRGIPVLAALRTIPGTSWHLVAKIAQAEVFAPVHDLAIGVGAMVAILIATAGFSVTLWWRRQHAQFLAMHFKNELERRALVEHFGYLSRFANDIILLVDEDYRIVEANDTAAKAYGYPRERLLQMRSSDLRASVALASFEADQAQIASRGSLIYQTVQQRSDGSTFPVECSVRVITVEGKQYRQAIIRDISERKRAEEALRASEERYRVIAESASDMILVIDADSRIEFVNPASENMFGYVREELIGQSLTMLMPEDLRPAHLGGLKRYIDTGRRGANWKMTELRARHKSGREFPVEISFGEFMRDGKHAFAGIVRNITERKRAEEALRESEWRFRQLAENIGEAFWFLSFEPEQLVFINSAFFKIWGIAEQDIRSRPQVLTESVHPDDGERVVRAFASWRARNSAQGYELEYRVVRPDGNIRWVCNHVAGVKNDRGGLWGACGVVEDITARKMAERQVERMTRLYATLSNTNKAIVWERTEDALFQSICRVAVDYGRFAGAAVGLADEKARVIRPLAFSESLRPYIDRALPSTDPALPEAHGPSGTAYRENRTCICNDFLADPASLPWRDIALSMGLRSVAALPLRRGGKAVGALTLLSSEVDAFDAEICALLEEMASDVSFALDNFDREAARARAEQSLTESEEKFRGLVEQSIAGIYIVEGERFNYINPRGAEIFGYTPEEMIGEPVTMAVADEDRALVAANVRKCLSGEARNLQYSFTGKCKDGSRVSVGVHGTRARIEGEPVVISLAQDISERERAQRQIQDHIQQLEEMMLGTINAVSTMVELRDPYTAGHEQRVGALAAAIGAESGLPASACKGLQIMGTVHDIGKMSVPADILSKPGKLNASEFGIITMHPQSGYDILKGVRFPWPLAQAILQHHERMDGSGYPNGLKGNQIIFEARILAVADVVEAIASHRPYRPAHGIDVAIEEIIRFRGIRYDAQVVDACVRLFREKAYQLAP